MNTECTYNYIGEIESGFTCVTTNVNEELKTGNLEFGLAIIITMMSLALVGFIWNSTTKKKPWK